MVRDIFQRFNAIQSNVNDSKKEFEEFINKLFGSEINYSFIEDVELRSRLEKHSLRMSFYRIGLGHNSDDSFENYCIYIYHQLEGLANYFFIKNYSNKFNILEYLFIEMKLRMDYFPTLGAKKESIFSELTGTKYEKKEEVELFYQSNSVFEVIKDYQLLSKKRAGDEFYEKYKNFFVKNKLTYYSNDASAKKADRDSFVDKVWKLDNKEIEKIEFQNKIAVLLWLINPTIAYLHSPIKQLSDWRNKELMHTSPNKLNNYIQSFKSRKDYVQLFELLYSVRTFVEENTKTLF